MRVATRRLTPLDEHILLGSETFWHLVSPDDAALRSHLHLKARSGRAGEAMLAFLDRHIVSFPSTLRLQHAAQQLQDGNERAD